MTLGGLSRSVRDDLRRNWRHMGAGGLGIALSVAALVFFLGLGLGVRSVLLGEVFPIDRIEVHRTEHRPQPIGPQDRTRQRHHGRGHRWPRSRPSTAWRRSIRRCGCSCRRWPAGGESLIGAGMQTELVADGIDPSLVADDVGDAFHDPRVDPSLLGMACSKRHELPRGHDLRRSLASRPG